MLGPPLHDVRSSSLLVLCGSEEHGVLVPDGFHSQLPLSFSLSGSDTGVLKCKHIFSSILVYFL